ncbi:UvrD/REP helicase [Striga asiatica]|uniref:UvrD/REP helicase n=1 Tax=Striga asiatica TaxID=4170 RepID=A0A5A7P824_STRAF|nr:UvrD/REP helicase [Striga asiatica]
MDGSPGISWWVGDRARAVCGLATLLGRVVAETARVVLCASALGHEDLMRDVVGTHGVLGMPRRVVRSSRVMLGTRKSCSGSRWFVRELPRHLQQKNQWAVKQPLSLIFVNFELESTANRVFSLLFGFMKLNGRKTLDLDVDRKRVNSDDRHQPPTDDQVRKTTPICACVMILGGVCG